MPSRSALRFERWFLAYLIFGFAVPGLAAILLPLVVVDAGHRPFRVGAVIAAQSFGVVLAPLSGWTADRFAIWRYAIIAGLLATGTALAGLADERSLSMLLACGFLLGVGSGICTTNAILLVTKTTAQRDWSGSLATLQLCGAAGAVLGLASAGVVGSRSGMRASAMLILAALLVMLSPRRATVRVCPPLRTEQPTGHNPVQSLHFGVFLLAFFLLSVATAGFASLYPITMADAFGVRVRYSSAVLAIATLASLPLYGYAAQVLDRIGPAELFAVGMAGRLVALLGLAWLSFADDKAKMAALCCAALFQATWPLIGAASIKLAVLLAPTNAGAVVGALQAAGALGSTVGALLSGAVADRLGYRDVAGAAAAVAVIASMCGLTLQRICPSLKPEPGNTLVEDPVGAARRPRTKRKFR